VAGRIEVTSGPAPQVAIFLPRALAQRLAQLQGRRVLIGSEVAQATALADVLHAQGIEIVSATTTEELVAQVRSSQPEMILADVRMLTPSPAVAVRRLRRSAAEASMIIHLAPTTADVEPGGAILSGADGYLLAIPPDEHFVAGLANLLAGDPPLAADVAGELLAATALAEEADGTSEGLRLGLTDRQQAILTLSVRGFTYREIAAQLYISERTVRYDALETRKRMGVARRSDMIEFAIEHDLVRGATGIESAVR
jgi:DNA-binding NarL/FixJ family response regulator